MAALYLLLLLAAVRTTASFQNHVDTTQTAAPSEQPQLQPKPELFPYQQDGVERLVSQKRLLLADEMGMGKTVQCIEALNRIGKEDSTILIICPKSVLGVWQQELEQWLNPDLASCWTVHIASMKEKPSPQPGSVTIINYDICFKLEKELHKPDYQVMICDECHALKSVDSKRTRSILGKMTGKRRKPGIQSEYLWLLTGTPVLNRPVELFPIVHSVDPDGFTDFDDYANRYCDPKTRDIYVRGRRVTVKEFSGAANLGELSKRLDPIMVRRCKSEVLTQLPPKLRSCRCLIADQDIAREERELLREALQGSGFNENTAGMDLNDFGSNAQQLLSYIEKGKSTKEMLATISAVRQETAQRKLDPAIELLEEYLTQEKVVVFVHHRAIFDSLMDHFGKTAVGIKGGIDRIERDEAVRQFQHDPNVRLFVGSIRACGLGLTLTAASHVVFLELDWSPGIMAQAEDRCHRVGQVSNVRVEYFVFKGTIDEWLSRSLIFKQHSIDEILPEKILPEPEEMPETDETGYLLDFGKHEGIPVSDAPRSYVRFLLQKEVWRKRPNLRRALASMGLLEEEPPPVMKTQQSAIAPLHASINNDQFEAADYMFDFGMYKGMKWEQVPTSYRKWILGKKIWRNRNREALLEALVRAGFDPNR
ncbi:regulator of chromatin subfamily A-like protein 1 [Seminavis robusta]|uniref:Regulator of chromatin subfamily A-like protein 1 n=1 Tax=Seminavis robusta TaxID=568900 RepID=A0A9N8EU54_9STRA|nr:regulator of chromatin subfamily A-like protein 1 [Seminavis robusta]|eukprot:Sro1885_g303530.1 regulator of chromatin subfamily A-like protein 1 (650) ;mRNA; f:1395-3536